MAASTCKTMDPRVRRTRQLLHEALDRLLETREFDAISIQDIADAATLNRATFYDHYSDKADLLRCHVALRFQALLDARGVRFDETCGSALTAMSLGVCDYLAGIHRTAGGGQRVLDPHLESAVINVVRGMVLDGMQRYSPGPPASFGMAAAAVSWAIYGGAKEWLETPDRVPSEEAATTIAGMVHPIISALGGVESITHPASDANSV